MNKAFILATLLATASPAFAQDTLTSTSGSNAGAVSGSASGASSDNQNANVQNGNIGVSENTNTSTSNSGAVSGSESTSGSISDQAQGQSQTSSNAQGQDQGQSQGQNQDQNLNAEQANQQGVTVNQTWNTKNRRQTEVRTNNAVPLAASSSFSSDYCGGTVSGGVSAAPIGISLGASGTRYDKSCQSLRRAEKFGMAAVNASNLGQPELAGRLMSMMIWSICTSDSAGTTAAEDTAQACNKLLLLGSGSSYASAQPAEAPAVSPRLASKGKVTPEAAFRAGVQSAQNDKATAVAAVTK